jgi:hypothetical protein
MRGPVAFLPVCVVLNKVASKPLPPHVSGMLAYLSQPNEKANEDLALAYFRKTFGEAFTRQKEASQSDGYVAGSFVLELKGKTNNWLDGLFQGLAYRNRGLDFTQIVVAAKNFLAVWRVEDIPEKIREELAAESGAPNSLGRQYAKKYSSRKTDLLKRAVWSGADLFTPLFLSQPDVVYAKLSLFEKTLREGLKVRQKITVRNFTKLLAEMKSFFDPDQPIKAVRAFYSMLYAWNETSIVNISQKAPDQAALGGELITDLIPGKRLKFKEFVEGHCITVDAENSHDDYFARYDEALDAVDKSFRIKNGIFFTDLDLSRFVMWLVRQHIPELGKHYLVIDPACGSGNLVTNWRSPLELRHKVVSEIEPELLFAVEQRMKGDSWHNGKFTVVPKVSENRGLNFLDCSAADYLEQVQLGLEEKGQAADKPLAFLCNPPYRSDDDQTASSIAYKVHKSILDLTGVDGANERYCCFLAQMKLICEAAKESGLPGDSLLLLFTKSTWLTKRPVFQDIRSQILGSFEHVAGALVQANEFFDVRGSWPVAFTVWRHKGPNENLNANRSVSLIDLTWVTKKHLAQIPWSDPGKLESACDEIIKNERSRSVTIGQDRISIREWAGGAMTDFKRDRRKIEKNAKIVGGLPTADHRQSNKKAYGETNGQYIGFMDDLTPCRVKNSIPEKPWLNLDNRFMAVKKSRCFSGPPTHLGYCASDIKTAKKLFFWYALGRTFVQRPYPMWIDADGMWAPTIPTSLEKSIFQTAFAIAYAENECVEAYFPANNPIKGTSELFVGNPMTPVNLESFWSQVLRPYFDGTASLSTKKLMDAVDNVFRIWKDRFKTKPEIAVSSKHPYFIDAGRLTKTAGMIQIKDYAVENNDTSLLASLHEVRNHLKTTKNEFFELVNDKLDYFGGQATPSQVLILPEKTKFERTLCRRLAVAALLVQHLHNDPNFGRTKLTKLFYLANVHERLDLETEYYREAAGPLDQRALYNERFGIEALAQKYHVFQPRSKGRMVIYEPSSDLETIEPFAKKYLGEKTQNIAAMANTFRSLTTDQSEIIATLYACWNDLLIQKRSPTDDAIASEFLHHWHPKKSRFSRARLIRAIAWMRIEGWVPKGIGKLTSTKPTHSSVEGG